MESSISKPNVGVLGYYGRGNLGDETYKLVFPLLFPSCTLTFCNIDEVTPTDLVVYSHLVCGGGDIINEYFTERLEHLCRSFPGPKISLSIGVSYPVYLEHRCLSLFDAIFIRNATDIRRLQQRTGISAHMLPDSAFLLEPPIRTVKESLAKIGHRLKIGLFLSPGQYSINSLVTLTESLAKKYELIFYRFNTGGVSTEDDVHINTSIAKGISLREFVHFDNNVYSPTAMLKRMVELDLAICMRYHAHIFAMISGVPFVSLNISRKVSLLTTECNMEEYTVTPYIDVETPAKDCVAVLAGASCGELSVPKGQQPIFSTKDILEKVEALVENRNEIGNYLSNAARKNRERLKTRQVEKCLLHARIGPRNCERHRLTPVEITRELAPMLREQIDHPTAEKIAGMMSLMITGSPNSEYVYGMTENLMKSTGLLEQVEWVVNDHAMKSRLESDHRFNMEYMRQDSYRGLHRAGWQFVVEYLRCLHHPNGVLLDTFVDRTFHWSENALLEQGIIPYTSPWVGFIHHTSLTSYSEYNTVVMFSKKSFIDSLPMCQGLYVLTEYLASWCRSALEILGYSDIPVEVLTHPTEFVERERNFSMGRFLANPEKKLIAIGAWLRDPFAINAVIVPPYLRKYALRGPQMENYFTPPKFTLDLMQYLGRIDTESEICDGEGSICRPHPICRPSDLKNMWIRGLVDYIWTHHLPISQVDYDESLPIGHRVTVIGLDGKVSRLLSLDLELKIASVTILPHMNNDDYDLLLRENIVFLCLLDASAVNTLIECIVRNTPIVVNRIPPVEEALGKEYPLYYDDIEEVDDLLTEPKIRRAYRYLKDLNKEPYRIENFITSIRSSEIYKKLDG